MFEKIKLKPLGHLYQIKFLVPALVLYVILFFFVDKPVSSYFNELINQYSFFYYSGKLVQICLNGVVLFPILIIWLYWLNKKQPETELFKILLLFILFLFFMNFFVSVLKFFIARGRPELWLKKGIYGFKFLSLNSKYWSFPSGHTTNIMVISIFAFVYFPRHFKMILALAFLIVLSRVWYVKHYFSDIFSTIIFVLLMFPLGVMFFDKLSTYPYFNKLKSSLDLFKNQWSKRVCNE